MDAKIKQLWDEKNYNGALELLTQASYGAVRDIQALELKLKLSELMGLVIQSQQKLDAGEKDSAIEFLHAAQVLQATAPEWVYQPLSFLEEYLGVDPLVLDASFESERAKQHERQKEQNDKVNSIIGTGSLSSWAEEELSKLEPGIAKEKLAAWIADKKQQVITLQTEAELAASEGDFEKADELYARLLELDPNNDEIAVRQFNIHNDIGRHAQLKENIEKAWQALARNDFRNADPFYKAAVELDKSGLHTEELQKLKEKWEEVRSKWDASVSHSYSDEKYFKRWPEEILNEITLIKKGPVNREADICSAIDNLVKGYIPAHTSKLASDLNLILSRDILEIEESIDALQEIDDHWKTHLDEPEFDVSEHYSGLKKRVKQTQDYLNFYMEMLPLVVSVKKGRQKASAAISSGNYIEARIILQVCLDEMPEVDEPAYAYLQQQIRSLKAQQEEIRLL